ncbi:MAG: hypothetical protein PHV51_07490 [Methanosarcinaceae archaeon]|nr:hypothetical protein [Methanosarcinaceae archaeon]
MRNRWPKARKIRKIRDIRKFWVLPVSSLRLSGFALKIRQLPERH